MGIILDGKQSPEDFDEAVTYFGSGKHAQIGADQVDVLGVSEVDC